MAEQLSTQSHIPVSAIYDDVIVTHKGLFAQIIMVNSLNFGLKSEEEQNAIIAQYQAFLNSLAFPIQITMHSKQLDLTNYVKDLENRIPQEPNELIRYQIQEYLDFIQKLISIANIMDKKFYITVPYQLPATELPKGGLLSTIFGNSRVHLKVPLKKFITIKGELEQRSGNIMSGLMSMGITSQTLSTKNLIELFYRTYNPEEAMREKITGEMEAIGVEAQAQAQGAQPQTEQSTNQPSQTTQVPINQAPLK
jgi:type IV secretory pathway VirB4 component